MRIAWHVVAGVAAIFSTIASADAGVLVKVDLSQQQMTVEVDGKRLYAWAVSTANSRYVTPTGTYRPQRMHKMWYSRKYDDAPMPHAIFYSGGFAIHGTGSIRMLGRPASHGCVRLAPGNAATLFDLVKQKGMGATKIIIHGTPPKSRAPAVAQRSPSPQRPETARVTYAAPPAPGLLSGLFGWEQPRYVQPVRIQRVNLSQPPRSRPLRPLPR